jgi:hypothetical protein
VSVSDDKKADDGGLSVLFPGEEVKAGGETITVKPFMFGQFPRAMKLLRPITDAVRSAGIAGFDGKRFFFAQDWPLRLPQLMDEVGEPLLEFIGFAAGKPRSWFDTIPPDEGIALARAAFQVNASFFVQRIAPSLGLAVQAETGEPLSPLSSEPVTPETASSE